MSPHAAIFMFPEGGMALFLASRICLCVCFTAAILYLFAALRTLSSPPLEILIFHIAFSVILAVLGVAFLFYYPYNRFSFLVGAFTAAFIYGGLILAYWFRTPGQRNTVLLIHAAVLLLLTFWKFSFTDIPWTARLPLNVCNILIIFVVLRPVLRRPMLDNYIICFGIIAGLMYFFTGSFFDDTMIDSSRGQGFFYYRVTESALLHNLFFSYSIYALITESVRINVKSAMANMIWITPVFILFIFVNQIWKTDYFFTGVHGITPEFLIKQYYSWPGRFTLAAGETPFEVNPLHSLYILSGASIVLLAMSSSLAALQHTVPGAFRRFLIPEPNLLRAR